MSAKERYRQKLRDRAIRLKSEPCKDCGKSYPYYVMDFHHRIGENKAFNIGPHLWNGSSKLIEEVSKCDLLCANCHRIRTYLESHAV